MPSETRETSQLRVDSWERSCISPIINCMTGWNFRIGVDDARHILAIYLYAFFYLLVGLDFAILKYNFTKFTTFA